MWVFGQFVIALVLHCFKYLAKFVANLFSLSVPQLLTALGVSFVTYQSSDILIGYVFDHFVIAFDGLPLAVTQILGLLYFDKCIAIIFAAYTAKAALAGALHSFTRMEFKK